MDGEPQTSERLSAEIVQTLYDLHASELLAFLTGVLKNHAAAQDVSQMTFRKLLASGHLADPDKLKGWLFTVATNEALQYRRAPTRDARQLAEYSNVDRTKPFAARAEDLLIRREGIGRLKGLLDRLPKDQQFVVQQRISENKTFAEIANELDISIGTVLTRMRLALQKLRDWISE